MSHPPLDLTDPDVILVAARTINDHYTPTPFSHLLESVVFSIVEKAKEDCINKVAPPDTCAGIRDGANYVLLQLINLVVVAEAIVQERQEKATAALGGQPIRDPRTPSSLFSGGGLVE